MLPDLEEEGSMNGAGPVVQMCFQGFRPGLPFQMGRHGEGKGGSIRTDL